MKVGIASSTEKSAIRNGQQVASRAMSAGKLDHAHLVLAFCTPDIDHTAFYKGLRMVVGPQPPIVGGSAVGIITNSEICFQGSAAGVMIIESNELRFHVASADHIDEDEANAGRSLALSLPDDPEAQLMLIFYDSIRIPGDAKNPPLMNASPPLIQGIQGALKAQVPILGAGVLGDLDFMPTYQFCGYHVGQQSVAGLLMTGAFKYYWRIMHGCTPLNGIYHTITRAHGAVLYEVDNRPIVSLIDELYGSSDWQNQRPVKRLTIGVNYGEKFADFDENSFVNRLIAGVLPRQEGIVMFEPDLSEGTEIMFMLRDAYEMIRSSKENTAALMEQIRQEGAKPVCAFYIDCAGRAARFSETITEEASEIVSILNRSQTPLLGFYSGVEIAPLLGQSRGLDWTGILLILAR